MLPQGADKLCLLESNVHELQVQRKGVVLAPYVSSAILHTMTKVLEWHITEIELHIGMNMHCTGTVFFVCAICDYNGFVAYVAK